MFNAVESFPATLRHKFPTPHPNFFDFLSKLQSITVDSMNDYRCRISGRIIRRAVRRKKQTNKRIQTLQNKFHTGAINRQQFLNGVAYNSECFIEVEKMLQII